MAQVGVPPLKARVTDLTGTLNPQQVSALEHNLAEFEHRKGSQIAVLLVPTTQPETPAAYSVRVFDQWKLGRKGIDDGALLLVAKQDRRIWITTGRGVEGVLPDAIVKRIVEEDITPRFKEGDFYAGIRAGTDRMMRLIEGEKFPPPRSSSAHPPQLPRWLDTQMIFLAVIVVALIGGILGTIFGRLAGAGIIGTIAGLAFWIFTSSFLFGAVAGLIAFMFALMMAGRSSGGWSSGGDWSSSSGGWSSGGGFSGGDSGGFSGGGGSTAGGGAGGSW